MVEENKDSALYESADRLATEQSVRSARRRYGISSESPPPRSKKAHAAEQEGEDILGPDCSSRASTISIQSGWCSLPGQAPMLEWRALERVGAAW